MFRRLLLVAVLLASCAAFSFSQARPVLGILPFTGGTGGDGETIATLISMEPAIMGAFTVVPRTASLNALFDEHYFQLAGLTDSDTIAGIGRMLNADYVLSGNIRRLGDRNLVIATIVNVETFEQVAGYYRTYFTIEEVRDFLPSMARSMIDNALGRGTERLPSLAMLPFAVAPGIDAQDAETLSMILAIEILNTGDYVVLPRTSTIQAALEEMDFQMLGYTDDEGMAALGRAINADFVLSGGVHRLGVLNMFTAQVLRVRDGSMFAGAARDYRVIADGVNLMVELAILLTDPEGAQERIAALHYVPRPSPFEDPTRFWSIGASIGSSFAEPMVIATLQGTLAPLRHSFFRVGCDLGFISDMDDTEYFSVSPFVHLAFFLPFGARGGWYIGAGGSFTMAEYRFYGYLVSRTIAALDLTTGFNIGNMFDISYTLRTTFSVVLHRVSAGFTWRFQR